MAARFAWPRVDNRFIRTIEATIPRQPDQPLSEPDIHHGLPDGAAGHSCRSVGCGSHASTHTVRTSAVSEKDTLLHSLPSSHHTPGLHVPSAHEAPCPVHMCPTTYMTGVDTGTPRVYTY